VEILRSLLDRVLRWGDVSWLEGFGWAVERLKFGVVGAEKKEKKALVGDGDVLDNVFREEKEKKESEFFDLRLRVM
jgi:hypothetical protein